MAGKRKLRTGEPTPSRPMTAVPSPARRRQAPVELARSLAAARAAQGAAAEAASRELLVTRWQTPSRGVPAIADTRTLREKARSRQGVADLLVFIAGGERFGIELGTVEEAIDLPPVHHVPEMPPAMAGVITVRGALTSVYSVRQALGLVRADGECALIFRRHRSRLALVIDDVDDVRPIDLGSLRDAPTVAASGVVLGVVRQGDLLLSLVDADALLVACQATPLLETA
jgi:purine-binding chemotaxis protein CheW